MERAIFSGCCTPFLSGNIFKSTLLVLAMFAVYSPAIAQKHYLQEKIVSTIAIKNEKAITRQEKLNSLIDSLASFTLDRNEAEIETAIWNMGQFLIDRPGGKNGLSKLLLQWQILPTDLLNSTLEAAYGLYPTDFNTPIAAIVRKTNQARTFALGACYLYRQNPTIRGELQALMRKKNWVGNTAILTELANWLLDQPVGHLPNLDSLWLHQQQHKFKMVYSFQRSNRNYPGLALVQNPDGRFVRDTAGNLQGFVQLARSASNLPWFITNGSTPQGLFSITGTAISANPYIGPTPNLQSAMMFEINPAVFTHYQPLRLSAPPDKLYRSYFPENWQQWSGILEAYTAGKLGRSAIIAHGSGINPNGYKAKPYYPVAPTMGCLSGYELWNETNGQLIKSDQLGLVNAFLSTPGIEGYLLVINLDNQKKPISLSELEAQVTHFEKTCLPKVP